MSTVCLHKHSSPEKVPLGSREHRGYGFGGALNHLRSLATAGSFSRFKILNHTFRKALLSWSLFNKRRDPFLKPGVSDTLRPVFWERETSAVNRQREPQTDGGACFPGKASQGLTESSRLLSERSYCKTGR